MIAVLSLRDAKCRSNVQPATDTTPLVSVPVCVGDPYDGNQQINGPFELGVFFALRDAERQGNGGKHDDELPPPECKIGKPVREQPNVTGALHDIIGTGKKARCRRRRK
jgi:hypothetical protein